MEITQVIDAYFEAIRAGDIEALMALYAQDAVFILPDGRELRGAEAIRAMHASVFSASAPSPSPGRQIVAESAAAVEIEAQLRDGSVKRTTNHYSLDEHGKIARLSVYTKT